MRAPQVELNAAWMTEQKVRTDDLLIACRVGRFAIGEWKLEAEQTAEGVFAERTILLVTEGKGQFMCGERHPVAIEPERIVVCPSDCSFRLEAETPVCVTAVRIDGINFTRSAIWSRSSEALANGILPMKPVIRTYTDGLRTCTAAGLADDTFTRLKACELLYLLRVSYPEVAFGSLESGSVRDAEFVRLVEQNWNKVKNKAELAAVTGLSISHLGVKFREVFGVPPYRWLTERRCEAIFHRLVYGQDSFRQIGADFHFRSAQHFNDFCKKHFGATPGVVRRTRGVVNR